MAIISRLFPTDRDSHKHSLNTLGILEQYTDFMDSVRTVYDMGSGSGLDTEWWATRQRDDGSAYNIRAYGVDIIDNANKVKTRDKLAFIKHDFEEYDEGIKADVIWCHDSFRCVNNPIQTLANWNRQMTAGGMLALITPQTTNLSDGNLLFRTMSGSPFAYDITNLIYLLALSGFDCNLGHFTKRPDDFWIHCIVYKSEHKPMDPRTTSWAELIEKNLIPESAALSVSKRGVLRQEDIFTHWISGHYCRWSEV
jgi:SAM-dependent methyltransferase